MNRLWHRIAAPIALLVGLLVLWEVGVRWLNLAPFILPSPVHVLDVFVRQFSDLVHHGAMTLAQIMVGLLLGASCGWLLAVAVFYSPLLDKALYPLIIGSQMIPVFAVAPILVVWLGYGMWPKAMVAALISFFPLAVNVSDGLREPTDELVELFVSLGASRWQIFWKLRWPASLPLLFSGLKVSATLSVIGGTIGEWVGAYRGLGYLMLQANARMRMGLVFACILMLALMGLCLFGSIRIIERRVVHWRAERRDRWEEGA